MLILNTYISTFQVNSQLQAVDNEIDTLLKFKAKLEKSLEATEHPQGVATSCLTYRQGREGIDMVHDDVEINLLKVFGHLNTSLDFKMPLFNYYYIIFTKAGCRLTNG